MTEQRRGIIPFTQQSLIPMKGGKMRYLKPLLLVPVVALVLSACNYTDADYSGNPAGPKVAIVGDGDLGQVNGALHTALDPTYQVRISGNEVTTPSNVNNIVDLADATLNEDGSITVGDNPPDVYVYMPPWLDVDQQVNDLPEYYYAHGGHIEGVNALAHSVGACFVLGTLPHDDAEVLNNDIRDPASQALFDYTVADWDAVVDANPSYQDSQGNVTPAGEAALVNVIEEAIASC